MERMHRRDEFPSLRLHFQVSGFVGAHEVEEGERKGARINACWKLHFICSLIDFDPPIIVFCQLIVRGKEREREREMDYYFTSFDIGNFSLARKYRDTF